MAEYGPMAPDPEDENNGHKQFATATIVTDALVGTGTTGTGQPVVVLQFVLPDGQRTPAYAVACFDTLAARLTPVAIGLLVSLIGAARSQPEAEVQRGTCVTCGTGIFGELVEEGRCLSCRT